MSPVSSVAFGQAERPTFLALKARSKIFTPSVTSTHQSFKILSLHRVISIEKVSDYCVCVWSSTVLMLLSFAQRDDLCLIAFQWVFCHVCFPYMMQDCHNETLQAPQDMIRFHMFSLSLSVCSAIIALGNVNAPPCLSLWYFSCVYSYISLICRCQFCWLGLICTALSWRQG